MTSHIALRTVYALTCYTVRITLAKLDRFSQFIQGASLEVVTEAL